jgi:hypothetical protein
MVVEASRCFLQSSSPYKNALSTFGPFVEFRKDDCQVYEHGNRGYERFIESGAEVIDSQ